MTDPERPTERRVVSRRSVLRRMVTTAAAFTALLLVSSVGVATVTYRHFDSRLHRVAPLLTSDRNIHQPAQQLHAANYLVIGSDSRAGTGSQYGGEVVGARSDTTMLVHLSPDRQRAIVISFPRDSWLAIPACPNGKGGTMPAHTGQFNSAFTDGGAACTVATVQKLTGIEVTHYVQIDFNGFTALVNALGSVTVCSPQAVSDPSSGLTLHAGQNKLDGREALAYVRARETLGNGSDLDRIRRQQRFLGALLREARGGRLLASPQALTSFVGAATKAITIDSATSLRDLKALADALRGLDPKRVTFYTAPIANPAYNPDNPSQPGGRVLLDARVGAVLYDSIINDRTKTVRPSSASSSAPSTTKTTKPLPSKAPSSGRRPTSTTSPAPTPTGISAADTTCTE